jgi:hypothetical protein
MMKNKLRKIIVDDLEYVYRVTDKYHRETRINTLTVKIFLVGHKQTPLVVEFHTIDHFYLGQLLKQNVELYNTKTNKAEGVNLNHPKNIRSLILHGIKNGWHGTNRIEIQNGLEFLTDSGYDISPLVPNFSL